MLEEWKEFTKDYSVSNFGRVRNNKNGKLRKLTTRNKRMGYLDTFVRGKNYSVHRLVATYFVVNPDPENFTVVHHIDNNPKNNHYTNLKWCTTKQNHEFAVEANRHTSQNNEDMIAHRGESGKVGKVKRNPRSGHKGIVVIESKRDGSIKYLVQLKGNYGRYKTLEEAKEVYKKVHFEWYGVYPEY